MIHDDPQPEKPNKLVSEGASSYLRALRSEISQYLANTDEGLRKKLGQVYNAAVYLREDKDQWQAFCEQEEWKDFKRRPKVNESDRSDAIRHAIRFAVGFDGAKSNSTVHRYNSALETCWKQNVPANEVPRRLAEEGGIEKMKRKATSQAISVRFLKNRLVDQVANAEFGFEALLYVRFSPKDGKPRQAEILAAYAKEGGRPSLKTFRQRVLNWQDNADESLEVTEKSTKTDGSVPL